MEGAVGHGNEGSVVGHLRGRKRGSGGWLWEDACILPQELSTKRQTEWRYDSVKEQGFGKKDIWGHWGGQYRKLLDLWNLAAIYSDQQS